MLLDCWKRQAQGGVKNDQRTGDYNWFPAILFDNWKGQHQGRAINGK